MKKTKIFDYIELKYDQLSEQINTWLKNLYGRSFLNLSPASPFGQILAVTKELFQHTIIYLKNSIRMLDIETTNNKKAIQYIARISGYDVGRSISATGTLKFKVKGGTDLSQILNNTIIIKNNLIIKNKTNNLKYSANLNTNEMLVTITNSNNYFFLPIIQGYFETQYFTGDGYLNQSYSVNVPSMLDIEQFNVFVKLNGISLSIKDSIWDMLPNEYACVVKSGFNGGVDIYFGNGNFGIVPPKGSIIEVKYLLTNGSNGEVLNNLNDDWIVEDEVKDINGNIIDINELFQITVENDINFASNGDDIEFIKKSIPKVSRNFVLSTPNQYIFHLSKLNMFSKINAYNKLDDNNFSISSDVIEKEMNKIIYYLNSKKSNVNIVNEFEKLKNLYLSYKNNLNDNEIYLYLIPDIRKYFSTDINYFNIPFEAFYLNDDEVEKIIKYLYNVGNNAITTNIKIIQPKISKYVMFVNVRRFNYGNEDNIRNDIITLTSNYLINNNRFDRLPKSDFIQLFKGIYGVDSVSVYFVSKKNEDYHRKFQNLNKVDDDEQNNILKRSLSSINTSVSKVVREPILSQGFVIVNGQIKEKEKYDKTRLLGLDSVHGDIIFDKDEYVVIRGGWRDRNGVWYNDGISSDALSSINIIFDNR